MKYVKEFFVGAYTGFLIWSIVFVLVLGAFKA